MPVDAVSTSFQNAIEKAQKVHSQHLLASWHVTSTPELPAALPATLMFRLCSSKEFLVMFAYYQPKAMVASLGQGSNEAKCKIVITDDCLVWEESPELFS